MPLYDAAAAAPAGVPQEHCATAACTLLACTCSAMRPAALLARHLLLLFEDMKKT
jgi:hypothetical protein